MTGIKLDSSPLVRALSRESARRREAALGAGRVLAARMEAHARTTRRWTDRTGRITLTGGAPYSAALETGYGERYAILGPTVRHFAPEFLRAIREGGA